MSLTPAFTSSSCISKAQGGVPVTLQKHESMLCTFQGNSRARHCGPTGKACDVQLHHRTFPGMMYIGTGNNLEAPLQLFVNSA